MEVMKILIDLLFVGAFMAGIGALIGSTKGRPVSGAIFGLLLGPLGWIGMALVESKLPKCPACQERIKPGALKCKHCGTALEGANEAVPGNMNRGEQRCPFCQRGVYEHMKNCSKCGNRLTWANGKPFKPAREVTT